MLIGRYRLWRAHYARIASLMRYTGVHWRLLVAMAWWGAVAVAASIAGPLIAQAAVDRALLRPDAVLFVKLAFAVAAVYLLQAITQGYRVFLQRSLLARVSFDLQRAVLYQLGRQPLFYFQKKAHGEHLFRLTQDVERVARITAYELPQALVDGVHALIVMAVLCALSPLMALVLVACAPLLYVVPYSFARRRETLWDTMYAHAERSFRHAAELFGQMVIIKAMHQEIFRLRRHMRTRIPGVRHFFAASRADFVSECAQDALLRVIAGGVWCIGGFLIIAGRLTLGGLSAVALYVNQLIGFHRSFATLAHEYIGSARSFEMVHALLSHPLARHNDAAGIPLGVEAPWEVEARHLTFGYRPGHPVVQDISFTIPAGSHSALVGVSGSGKTTLAMLLLRVCMPWEGQVLLGRVSLSRLSVSSLQRGVGVALQKPYLWNDTIAENIRAGNPQVTPALLCQAALACGVNEFAQNLTQGLDTLVGEGGCKLSEGQKQKIALARALVHRPKLLILDEALAAIDSASETAIMRAIKRLYAPLTVISISHRWSTVAACDTVHFLKSPKELVCATGCELFAKEDLFRALFAAQLESVEEARVLRGDS
jgi:ATP-binding cassette subfamily B protein